jgi:hypothetical protein
MYQRELATVLASWITKHKTRFSSFSQMTMDGSGCDLSAQDLAEAIWDSGHKYVMYRLEFTADGPGIVVLFD